MIKPVTLGPFLKGIDSSTDPYTSPKGSVKRMSNLVYTQRGGLTDCDGASIINAFNGAIQSNNGRFMSIIMFNPQGVNPYYVALKQAPDQHLGAPVAVSATHSNGGTLPTGVQQFYKITALDGAGRETTASNEVSATPSSTNLSVTLVWNIIPNAVAYNVYRGTTTGTEVLLVKGGLPSLQPNPLTATVTYIDNGTAVSSGTTAAVATAIDYGGYVLFQYVTASSTTIQPGQTIIGSGFSDGVFNGPKTVYSVPNNQTFNVIGYADLGSGIAGTVTYGGTTPPIADTTSQTALFIMPSTRAYSDSNIVALFPGTAATLGGSPLGTGQGNSTPSGGIAGLCSLIPQMVQFTNRIIMALGNGFPMQVLSDPTGTAINPSLTGAVTSVSVSGDQVTVHVSGTPFTSSNLPVGSNVVLFPMTDATYNGVFQVISSTSSSFVIRNTNASGGASTGAFNVTVIPLTVNTFIPAYPGWAANSAYALNSIVQPVTTPETYYFKAVQAGISNATTEPTWTNAAALGQQIADGTIIWENQGAIQSSAPTPPGAGHITVYSGSLWAWNTWPTDTANGLDGPTSLRMSDVNNPFSWNPINQAFLDKDDGTEGMGLGTFTISAEGIPPEGSLVVFKNYFAYQIVGVFGSSNFAIQRIRSDMGCTAPRTIKFVPGFGIIRTAHLGFANFDGVRDQLISEPVRPYLFPTNDIVDADIVVVDPAWSPISQADLTVSPPMYCLAAPVDNSGGAIMRIFTYDLVLKAWGIIDLPFPISVIYQARPVTTNPITLLGAFSDGTLQSWQNQASNWADPVPNQLVAWSVTLPDIYAPNPDQKMQCRRLVVRGISSGATSLSIAFVINGVAQPPQTFPLPASGDFEVFAGLLRDGLRFAAILSGMGHIEIDRVTFHLSPKAVGVPSVVS